MHLDTTTASRSFGEEAPMPNTFTLADITMAPISLSEWGKLLRNTAPYRGKRNMKLRISIGDVLISNGLDDALRCTKLLPPRVMVASVLPAVKRASKYADDQRVTDCIAKIERWVDGDDSVNLLSAQLWVMDARDDARREGRDAAAAAALAAARLVQINGLGSALWAALWAARASEYGGAMENDRHKQYRELMTMFPPLVLTKKEQGNAA